MDQQKKLLREILDHMIWKRYDLSSRFFVLVIVRVLLDFARGVYVVDHLNYSEKWGRFSVRTMARPFQMFVTISSRIP